jgi:hypothetical protein
LPKWPNKNNKIISKQKNHIWSNQLAFLFVPVPRPGVEILLHEKFEIVVMNSTRFFGVMITFNELNEVCGVLPQLK